MSVYVLGTGLSHDGSSCLIKDGELIVAIEKERLTRRKHDGGNDFLSAQYCLDTAGIKAKDLALIVQAANFEMDIARNRYLGKRIFEHAPDVPLVTISHHLAHAWGAALSSGFKTCNVMVIDGCGSPFEQCIDKDGATFPSYDYQTGLFCEKDSFYYFDGKDMQTIFKDFSEVRLHQNKHPLQFTTNYHSIGALYSAVSSYCFGNMDDAGKLMGLAPYGLSATAKPGIFKLKEGIVEIDHEAIAAYFNSPALNYEAFKANFQHYADLAKWVQQETEKAIVYLFNQRYCMHPHPNMAYAGGVALNAVANQQLLKQKSVQQLFMQPAAGDNGLSIGCAWYGWIKVLNNSWQASSPTPFLGRSYSTHAIEEAIRRFEDEKQIRLKVKRDEQYIKTTAGLLAQGKVVGWFHGGAEFGPRSLGHRSILAQPGNKDTRTHINRNIKFREDFRPFAPSVQKEKAGTYFIHGWDSPYMILIDEIRPEWKDVMPAIIHEDGSCRVQTVDHAWNPGFHQLLGEFEAISGIGVLLNTSLNRKGMPIVETPLEALDLFYSGAMDILVLHHIIISK